jgi:hypothetical protein
MVLLWMSYYWALLLPHSAADILLTWVYCLCLLYHSLLHLGWLWRALLLHLLICSLGWFVTICSFGVVLILLTYDVNVSTIRPFVFKWLFVYSSILPLFWFTLSWGLFYFIVLVIHFIVEVTYCVVGLIWGCVTWAHSRWCWVCWHSSMGSGATWEALEAISIELLRLCVPREAHLICMHVPRCGAAACSYFLPKFPHLLCPWRMLEAGRHSAFAFLSMTFSSWLPCFRVDL